MLKRVRRSVHTENSFFSIVPRLWLAVFLLVLIFLTRSGVAELRGVRAPSKEIPTSSERWLSRILVCGLSFRVLDVCDLGGNTLFRFSRFFISVFFFLESNESAIFVITRHGGHLGFFEGGLLAVNPITWLDKALIQYTTAVMQANRSEDHLPLDNQIGNFVIAS